MTDKKDYNIPLRKAFLKAPQYRRTKRAISEVKIFLKRHLKAKEVKLGKNLNLRMWQNGIKNPPHHIKVTAFLDGETAKAELFGYEYKEMTSKDREALEEKVSKKEKKEAKDSVVESNAEEVQEETTEEMTETTEEKETKAKKPKKAPAKKKTAKKEE